MRNINYCPRVYLYQWKFYLESLNAAQQITNLRLRRDAGPRQAGPRQAEPQATDVRQGCAPPARRPRLGVPNEATAYQGLC